MSNDSGNSDSQNDILETIENTNTREIEVRKWFCILLAKVYNGHNGYVLSHAFGNGLIGSFGVFYLCTGSLTLCAQAHH